MSKYPVVIIGGGLAGLNCARLLTNHQVDFLLLDASDALGGRVRTDEVGGFKLDRGFQVFQTAYPEAQLALDYNSLELRELEPGALVRRDGRWHRMSDPWRRPTQALATLFNDIGTLGDRFKLLRLRRDVSRQSAQQLLSNPEDCSTLTLLGDHYGFSMDFIDGFMRPWLSGIFLESNLETSANFFRFVFKMLSAGPIAYPRRGIQAIPEQLQVELPPRQVRTQTTVARIDGCKIEMAHGEIIEAEQIVMATDASATQEILSSAAVDREWNGTTCIYFAADEPPSTEKCLMLNGQGTGQVNHVFIPTNSIPELAPAGKTLINISTVGLAERDPLSLVPAILNELKSWFGEKVHTWQHLRTYDVHHAVIRQRPGMYQELSAQRSDGLILAGDQIETSSVNGALRSGRLAAESVLASRAR